ncbi:MAG: long-chain-fatty-acid--CoA ligase [Rhodospirillales bacterium]|nr:long-chain-fatty-acid--CoA ligase [Rhodospirillales bacterium]
MDISDWIDRRAVFSPDKAAIRFKGESVSYKALSEKVGHLTSVLRGALGIQKGARVAYLGYNSPELVALVFACARVGAIFLPMNWRLAGPEHAYVLSDSEPAAIFVEEEFADTLDGISQDIPESHIVKFGIARDGWHSYETLMNLSSGGRQRDPRVSYDDPALLVYTSGTTGRPKGAVLTQNALFYAAVNSAHMHDMTSQDIVLTTLPMFHVGGMNIQTLPALHAGATVVLQDKFDVNGTYADIETEKVTLTTLVPAQLGGMMADPRWKKSKFKSLRSISTGSTLVPEALTEAVHAKGLPLLQVYGSTETSPIAVFLVADDADNRIGSTGKCAVHCDMRIVDNEGNDLPVGESGEILIKGPNVLIAYWNNPEATAEALKDGWFHTGDIGHQDEEGFLFVDDRKKDMIISGGENIYPAALENILAESGDLIEASVVGRDDEKWGEVPVVVAVRKSEKITESEVKALFKGKIAKFQHPKDVFFVEQLPRNAMGKIVKDEIRTMVRDGSLN